MCLYVYINVFSWIIIFFLGIKEWICLTLLCFFSVQRSYSQCPVVPSVASAAAVLQGCGHLPCLAARGPVGRKCGTDCWLPWSVGVGGGYRGGGVSLCVAMHAWCVCVCSGGGGGVHANVCVAMCVSVCMCLGGYVWMWVCCVCMCGHVDRCVGVALDLCVCVCVCVCVWRGGWLGGHRSGWVFVCGCMHVCLVVNKHTFLSSDIPLCRDTEETRHMTHRFPLKQLTFSFRQPSLLFSSSDLWPCFLLWPRRVWPVNLPPVRWLSKTLLRQLLQGHPKDRWLQGAPGVVQTLPLSKPLVSMSAAWKREKI